MKYTKKVPLKQGVLAFAAYFVVSSGALCEEKVWRFDAGPAESAVMEGYRGLTGSDVYSAARGYGWRGTAPTGVVFGYPGSEEQRRRAGANSSRGGTNWMDEFVDENRNDLNRDGLISAADVSFRLDVPDGTYRVTLTLGDLSKEIGSIVVKINTETVEERVAAWAPGGYRSLHKTPIGWWTQVRHTVDVRDGAIEVLLTSDSSYYDEHMKEQATWENPIGVHWRSDTTKKDPPYHYIGFPFIRHGIMAIEVTPGARPPVVSDGDSLRLSPRVRSAPLHAAISKYNSGDFAGALQTLEGVAEPGAQVGKAIVQLYLAGRPEVEKEEELTPAAIEILTEHVAKYPDEHGVEELLRDARIFHKGLRTHLDRGRMRWIDGVPVQRNHFIENDKAFAFLWMIKPGSPLYYKARLYAGQAVHMLMPYIPTLNTAKRIFEELHEKFPDNRYVRFYMDYRWDPHGEGGGRTDWILHDYYSETEGSPEWARLLQANYAQMIDWAEYWIRHKQYPEGNIGGGFGDDVEIVGAFGYLGYLSKGVSEELVAGAGKLVEGMWNLSEIDPEIGFCQPMADAEHSAEWTGNTLGMMAQIDYGNPLWIERSLKTAKLMRDLWTAFDTAGRRRFRANFFGATQVGRGDQMNDSWINYRAVRPASAVLAYNQNPAISELFVELADAWLASAMSTARGKPMGVMPAQVSFPDAIPGGTNSPNWWTASHPKGTVNYDWAGVKGQRYKGYIQDLFLIAYQQTGDAKYLEPIRLEHALADRFGRAADLRGRERLGKAPWLQSMRDTRSGIDILLKRWTPPSRNVATSGTSAAVIAPKPRQKQKIALHPGDEEWVATELKGTEQWLKAKRVIEGRKGKLVNDITKTQIEDQMLFAQQMRNMVWPLMTTQASATDRVPMPGLLPVLFTYTGGGFGGPMIRAPITYADTTKYFAAAVMAADAQGFRILYHSMARDELEIGIVPWELEPSGEYTLRYGPDADEDEKIDSVTEERTFVWPQAGTPIQIRVAPKTTYLIELDQQRRGRIASKAPDPAISAGDIRYNPERSLLLVRVHNVGSIPVKNLEVVFYDGDPDDGGKEIGRSIVPNLEAPNDLEPRTVTVGVNWTLVEDSCDVYVVLDPENKITDEITTFNNAAHSRLEWRKPHKSWAEI